MNPTFSYVHPKEKRCRVFELELVRRQQAWAAVLSCFLRQPQSQLPQR